jgi:hypothetical protein
MGEMTRILNYKYLFFFTVAFYCLVLAQFGFENFDTGYIPSFSWRIVNGASVYEDFIYKGPPATLYFHAIFMKVLPETAQFLQIRVLFYCMFALQVFLLVSAFYRLYNLEKFNRWGLMTVGFIVSLLNFSPYPWPTTDGLLFAVIAFWMVARFDKPGFLMLFGIACFSVLSALTKQSFYLVPAFFGFWVLVRYGWKPMLVFGFQVVSLIAIYLCWILSITDWHNFIHQTTGQTPLIYLFYTGFHNYVFLPVSWLLALFVASVLCAFVYIRMGKRPFSDLVPILKWLAISGFAIAYGFCLFGEIREASRIAFDAAIVGVACAFLERKDWTFIAPFLVTLGIAWSCSISLGYDYPILFATGILLAFLVYAEINIKPNYYLWIALPVCAIALAFNIKPYRDANIFTLQYPLDAVSPKLIGIKTSKDYQEKHLELKNLVAQYGKNFIVAPSLPMAHYLMGTQSKLPADWIIETEIDQQQKRILTLAADKNNYVFLEKSFLNHEAYVQDNLAEFSSVGVFIHDKFNKIAETKHFIIYNSLKADERLP